MHGLHRTDIAEIANAIREKDALRHAEEDDNVHRLQDLDQSIALDWEAFMYKILDVKSGEAGTPPPPSSPKSDTGKIGIRLAQVTAASAEDIADQGHEARSAQSGALPASPPSGDEKIATSIEPAKNHASELPRPTLPETFSCKSLEAVAGLWLIANTGESFELRTTKEDSPEEAPVAPQQRRLSYIQRLPEGVVLVGTLAPTSGRQWPWEVELSDESRRRFRVQGRSQMLVQTWDAGARQWQQECRAERPRVFAFYNANDHPQGHRFVHLSSCEGRGGRGVGEFPIVGLTAGWLPADSARTASHGLTGPTPGNQRVQLCGCFCDPFNIAPPVKASLKAEEYATWAVGRQTNGMAQMARYFGGGTERLKTHGLFRAGLRQLPGRDDAWQKGLEVDISADLVMQTRSNNAAQQPPTPLVSIICFRWYNYWSEAKQSSDYSVLNDGLFVDLFNGPCSLGKLLPGEYEVYTVFIRKTKDLLKLNPKNLRHMLRGFNESAWYFLWPSVDGEAGCVDEREFFHFCQAMERCAVRTGWPHESPVYRLLCGKLWIPQMCLNKEFRVPPTTRIHYADFKQNRVRAARKAIEALRKLKEFVWGEGAVQAENFKGVVKLGFSWCGADVLPFKGPASLATNLAKLFGHQRCDNTICLVQEMVAANGGHEHLVEGEHRILVMRDSAAPGFRKESIWMQAAPPQEGFYKHNVHHSDVSGFKTASHVTLAPREVERQLFKGDRQAKQMAEEMAQRTADAWLRWFTTETPEPPQCTRIDFLVTHSRDGNGAVWTCEVGECGASLCTVDVHGRNVAALNRAVQWDESARFPVAMPDKIPRNDGSKG